MGKRSSSSTKLQKESTWRDRLKRFALSEQSVEVFCRNEAVSTASFYGWRTKLRGREDGSSVPFIDLGTVPGIAGHKATAPRIESPSIAPGIEVRIDLGGVVLTIMRH